MNHKPVINLYQSIDSLLTEAKRQAAENPANGLQTCCKQGCFACCFEPVFASENEIDYLLSTLTHEQIEALAQPVALWYEAFKPFLEVSNREGIAFPYRDARIACPLLKNGMRSVYAARPVSCRMFFARENPENCNMPARRHQKFAFLEGHPAFQAVFAEFAFQSKALAFDHFGLLLYNRLFGKDIRSALAERVEFSPPEESSPAVERECHDSQGLGRPVPTAGV